MSGEGDAALDNMTAEQVRRLLDISSEIGAHTERWAILEWLRKNSADILSEHDLDPKLQDYGAMLLQLVIDALAHKEHWKHANITQETIQ